MAALTVQPLHVTVNKDHYSHFPIIVCVEFVCHYAFKCQTVLNTFFGGAQSLQRGFPVNFNGSRWEGVDRTNYHHHRCQ